MCDSAFILVPTKAFPQIPLQDLDFTTVRICLCECLGINHTMKAECLLATGNTDVGRDRTSS
jgi:hypothetical protein